MNTAGTRTLLALLASALSAIPLCTLLSDRGWLVDVWLTMVIVVAPALLLRLGRAPGALQVWPGVVLLIPWLTARFLSDTALLGVIPTADSWHRLSALLDNLHHITQDEVAPVHSTVAVKLALCAMLGLLAALVDLIAVVGRHGALAGVPLLVVYTVAGAVPHHPVSWWLFLAPGVGFLILLALDARDDRASWGHRVSRSGRALAKPAGALAGQRVAVLALAVAIVLPLATPGGGKNLIALLSGGSGSGSGSGSGKIDPFAALKGELTRTDTLDLAKITITDNASVNPLYLRENVLSVYTGAGWRAAHDYGPTQDVAQSQFGSNPTFGATPVTRFEADIEVLGLTSNPPVFALPAALSGLAGATWSPQDQLLLGKSVHRGQSFTETVVQPEPSVAQLEAAPAADASLSQWVQLPSIPAMVRKLVTKLTADKHGPYRKALAISDYFADPANDFQYSLQTKQGDSGNDLVDFLTNRVGYCQQYAAAMAVMLRLAQVPARVVLGYTHPVPSANRTFTVTTDDAHAWVEAYFTGVGWVPFDPTPLGGDPGARTSTFPWQVTPDGSSTGVEQEPTVTTAPPTTPGGTSQSSSSTPATTAAAAAGAHGVAGWLVTLLVLLAVVLVLLAPWFVRQRRRRRRLHAAHGGDPDPLWAELSDTAVDLGYVWSPTRSPRQVARWLGDAAGDARGSLNTLAHAVEQRRYAAPGTATTGDLRRDLAAVTAGLRVGLDRSARARALLLPASLRWLRWLRPRRR